MIKSVHPSLQSVLNVFFSKSEYTKMAAVTKLLRIWTKYEKQYKDAVSRNINCKIKKRDKTNPFIVLEGLDGCGKSKISTVLSVAYGFKRKITPPNAIFDLKWNFEQDFMLLRAYYALGNYIAAVEAEKILTNHPLVLDRYWHSTAAYAIANEVTNVGAKLPRKGNPVYNWPSDLKKPDFSFFLDVDEKIRNERLSQRKYATPEEEKLKQQATFRNWTLEAYARMRDPSVIKIDANADVDTVVETIAGIIQKNGFLLEKRI